MLLHSCLCPCVPVFTRMRWGPAHIPGGLTDCAANGLVMGPGYFFKRKSIPLVHFIEPELKQ